MAAPPAIEKLEAHGNRGAHHPAISYALTYEPIVAPGGQRRLATSEWHAQQWLSR